MATAARGTLATAARGEEAYYDCVRQRCASTLDSQRHLARADGREHVGGTVRREKSPVGVDRTQLCSDFGFSPRGAGGCGAAVFHTRRV